MGYIGGGRKGVEWEGGKGGGGLISPFVAEDRFDNV